VVVRAWLGQGALCTQAGRRSGVLAALLGLTPRFSAFLVQHSWSARSEQICWRNEHMTSQGRLGPRSNCVDQEDSQDQL
jgi:hypothetical protein